MFTEAHEYADILAVYVLNKTEALIEKKL